MAHIRNLYEALTTRTRFAITTIVAILLITSVILFALLSKPPDWTLDVGGAGDVRYLANFYQYEYDGDTSFRWSSPYSLLMLYGSHGGVSLLDMRIHSDDAGDASRHRIGLSQRGETVARFKLQPGWRNYTLLLPATSLNGFAPPQLALLTDQYDSDSHDGRELGIPLDYVYLHHLTNTHIPYAVVTQRTLLLVWAIVVITSLLWIMSKFWQTSMPTEPHKEKDVTTETGNFLQKETKIQREDAKMQSRKDSGQRKGVSQQDRYTHIFDVSRHLAVVSSVIILWVWRSPATLAWLWNETGNLLIPITVVVFLLVAIQLFKQHPSHKQHDTDTDQANRESPKIIIHKQFLLVVLIVLIIMLHGILLFPLPIAWENTLAWVAMGIPGGLLLYTLNRQEPDSLARAFLMLCGALIVSPLLLLIVQALPGAVPNWSLLIVCDVMSIVLIRHLWQHTSKQEPRTLELCWETRRDVACNVSPVRLRRTGGVARYAPTEGNRGACSSVPLSQQSPLVSGPDQRRAFASKEQSKIAILLLILMVAAFFRFVYLGNAEYQGDEGQPMIMAAGMIQGYDDILLMHRKGPMEILLPGVAMSLKSHITEWGARLPFAIAGMGCILGGYLLASRMFKNRTIGLIAAAILTLDGFFIGFSRIVQYQNIVILMTIGGLWLCWRFYEQGNTRHLLLAAWFAAVGILSHYDGIFGLPAMAWLVVMGGIRHQWKGWKQWVRHLIPPMLVGAGVLAAFYIPFVLHEHFARTLDYLVTMRIGERDETGMFFNNLPGYYLIMAFYNTTYHVKMLAVLLATALFAWIIRYALPKIAGISMALLFLLSCIAMVWKPELFQPTSHINLAIVAIGLPLALLLVSPALSTPLRVLLIWFAFPFIAESFLIAEPNTHFYTMHVAVALIIAHFIVQSATWLRRHQQAWVFAPFILVSSMVLLISLPYTYIIFIQQYPEYERAYPDERPHIYLASYGDKSPRGGYFGFPHRDGWKAVAELYRQGILQGNYDSNQKSLITTWYIRNVQRGGKDPLYYFAVRIKGNLFIPKNYYPFGSIMINNRRILDIYTREPMTKQRQYFHFEDYASTFDQRPVRFPIQWEFLEIAPRGTKKE